VKKKASKKSSAAQALSLDQVRELIDLLEERGLEEFELERSGLRIRIKRCSGGVPGPLPAATVLEAFPAAANASPSAEPAPVAAPPELAEAGEAQLREELHIVKSPIVGTFYAAPAPGAAPFVDVGDSVEVGQVLCIIEAMKLMNEIEADVAGELMRIYVENGQPVEYGESLFAIRPQRRK